MSEQMRWYSVNDPNHKPTGLCLIAYRNPKGGWFYSTDFAGQDGSFRDTYDGLRVFYWAKISPPEECGADRADRVGHTTYKKEGAYERWSFYHPQSR